MAEETPKEKQTDEARLDDEVKAAIAMARAGFAAGPKPPKKASCMALAVGVVILTWVLLFLFGWFWIAGEKEYQPVSHPQLTDIGHNYQVAIPSSWSVISSSKWVSPSEVHLTVEHNTARGLKMNPRFGAEVVSNEYTPVAYGNSLRTRLKNVKKIIRSNRFVLGDLRGVEAILKMKDSRTVHCFAVVDRHMQVTELRFVLPKDIGEDEDAVFRSLVRRQGGPPALPRPPPQPKPEIRVTKVENAEIFVMILQRKETCYEGTDGNYLYLSSIVTVNGKGEPRLYRLPADAVSTEMIEQEVKAKGAVIKTDLPAITAWREKAGLKK